MSLSSPPLPLCHHSYLDSHRRDFSSAAASSSSPHPISAPSSSPSPSSASHHPSTLSVASATLNNRPQQTVPNTHLPYFAPLSYSAFRQLFLYSHHVETDQIKQICIVGAGNAAQAIPALQGRKRKVSASIVKTSVLAPFGDECQRLYEAASQNDGISLKIPDRNCIKGMPDIITKDPETALKDTQIVTFSVPLFAMQSMLQLTAPHVEHGT